MAWSVNLLPDQRTAASHVGRHARLLAGPGTGKTLTLTRRVCFLVEDQRIAPTSILALTFTRAAAQELRRRIQTELGPEGLPRVSTLHSFALRQTAAQCDEDYSPTTTPPHCRRLGRAAYHPRGPKATAAFSARERGTRAFQRAVLRLAEPDCGSGGLGKAISESAVSRRLARASIHLRLRAARRACIPAQACLGAGSGIVPSMARRLIYWLTSTKISTAAILQSLKQSQTAELRSTAQATTIKASTASEKHTPRASGDSKKTTKTLNH